VQLKRDERGFTLIEVLITMTLMGVVSLGLADLVIDALRQMSATSDRLDLAQDAQLAATYFSRDVAAVGVRDYGAAAAGESLPFKSSVQLDAAYTTEAVCGPLPVAALRLLSDDWDISATPAVRRTAAVVYYLKPAGEVSELHRARCVGPATTPSSDVLLAANVKPGSVTVTCSTPCTAAQVPEAITLRLLMTRPSTGDYEVVLSGLRRQS
jgi:prepilin-type N-terminal cleavage/methylation domain-containing protein